MVPSEIHPYKIFTSFFLRQKNRAAISSALSVAIVAALNDSAGTLTGRTLLIGHGSLESRPVAWAAFFKPTKLAPRNETSFLNMAPVAFLADAVLVPQRPVFMTGPRGIEPSIVSGGGAVIVEGHLVVQDTVDGAIIRRDAEGAPLKGHR